MTTLADLLESPSEDDLESQMLSLLQIAGFPVTQWQSGGVARTIVKLIVKSTVDLYGLVAKIAASGFNSTAAGAWLTLLADEVFDNQRRLATFATGSIGLASSVAAPDYPIQAGQLWFTWPLTGLRYQNTDGGTLLSGGTLTLHWRAESPGAAYNAPTGGVSSLATPLAGVTISGSATEVLGTDDESDAGLQARNIGKWGAVGATANDQGYEAFARAASAQVTRVGVSEVDSAVTVVLAGPTGTVPGSAVTDVSAYINGPPTVRRPLGVRVAVQAAAERVIHVVGTLVVPTGTMVPQIRAAAAIQAYVNGLALAASSSGDADDGGVTVFRSQIEAAALSPFPKNAHVDISAPSTDVILNAGEVATVDLTGLAVSFL